MSTFDRNPLEAFDDDALRAGLRGALDVPVHSPESVLEALRPRLRATRRRYIATRAGATATALVAALFVIAGLHGGNSANGLHIDTRPAGQPPASVPVNPAPSRGSLGSTTTSAASPPPVDQRSRRPGRASPPTTPLPPGAAPPAPSGAPVLTLPPTVIDPNNGAPRPGAGSGDTPAPSTTSSPSTTTSSEPPTTTVPASGSEVFTVKDNTGFVFGTVQVEWQGSSLTFDGTNPCGICTFVKSQGDPNELDVTFTRTTDSAQAHLHLEMRSQPAWHPVVD
jgi:hypothetical protein